MTGHDRSKRALRATGVAGLALLVGGMTAWAMLAIYYSSGLGEPLRMALAAAFATGTLLAFLVLPDRRRTLLGFAAAFAVVLVWWMSIEPSNERDWQTEVAVLPYATLDGELVTLHNVRNFDYRTEQDFVARYDDRTLDLRSLDAVDLIAVYWAGDAIAHIMVSFGFAGDHVAISIETRKEKGEAYSSVAGFFKSYELIYVLGDERDLIRVRTNYRQPE
jgi:4-amino-4-deoxy-L-arabinose transferase-like glycosyltransferase